MGSVSIRQAVAVVVTFNNEETIERCLVALSTATQQSGLEWRVVVVDNASTDGTVARTRQLTDALAPTLQITLLENAVNVGFARAVNMCVRTQAAEWVLLLNPDCYVFPDALSAAHAAAERHPGDGVVVQLYNPDGTVQPSAGAIPLPSTVLRRRVTRKPQGPYLNLDDTALWEHDTAVEWAHFAFLFISSETWHTLGGLDESYWLYGEDMDFCSRLSRSGRRLWWTPQGGATHVGGHSGTPAPFLAKRRAVRSWSHFLATHGRQSQRALLYASTAYTLPRAALQAARRRPR